MKRDKTCIPSESNKRMSPVWTIPGVKEPKLVYTVAVLRAKPAYAININSSKYQKLPPHFSVVFVIIKKIITPWNVNF